MGGYPALAIRPQEGLLQQYGEAQQIVGGQQRQQLGAIQLQEARLNQQSQQVLMQAFARNNGDLNKTYDEAAASGQVTPQMLNQFKLSSVQVQTQLANLTEKQLENLSKTHDQLANALEAVKASPVEQRPGAIAQQFFNLQKAGVNVQEIAPAIQHLPDFSDASINQIELGLKGSQWLAANEKAQREQRQAPSDAEVEAQRQATLRETVEKGNQAAATASLDLEKQRQLGKVTEADVYKEQQANYRALIQRQATLANELQKNGLTQLDKMFTDPQHGYTQFLAQAQSTKNTIEASKNGNELASSLEPLMLALGVTSYAGIHRINTTEINAAGPQVGSLYRRLDAIVSKAGTGSIPKETLDEASTIVDMLIDSKHQGLINGANMVAANGGLDPKKTVVMNRSGVITTLDKAGEGNTYGQPPAVKATHRYNPTTGNIEEIK